MKIAVNTRMLQKDKMEGIGYFSYETLKRITRNHPKHHFIFLFDRNFSNGFIFSDNVEAMIISPAARHPLLMAYWFQYRLPKVLKKLKPDIYLSPDGNLAMSSTTPSVAVIHDVNFEHYPEDIPFFARNYFRFYYPKFARGATRLATVSEFSKMDIAKHYSIDENKIDVVYNGIGENFYPLGESEKKTVREKYSAGKEYFLFVGSIHERKNISNMLLGFEAMKATSPSNIKLVLAGAKRWWSDDMEKVLQKMKFKGDVIFTGRLDESSLQKIMASALSLVLVSKFEGFGIPLIEAMNCDVPIITSNVTSLPEIAADAAILVDPFSVDSIKEGMLRMSKDDELRKSLIEKGKERRKAFSWDKSAEVLWNTIQKALEKN